MAKQSIEMAAMKEQLEAMKVAMAQRPPNGGLEEQKRRGFTIPVGPTFEGGARKYAVDESQASGFYQTLGNPVFPGLDQSWDLQSAQQWGKARRLSGGQASWMPGFQE